MNSGLFDVVGNIALGVRCIPRTSNAQCTSKVRSIDDPRESVGFLSASVGSWGGRCRVRRVESLK